MKYRILGKTDYNISEISLGTWQVGGKWGSEFNYKNAEHILNTAVDHGINFIDTADVYSNRESEKAVGKLIKSRSERIYVATKCGRFIHPHINKNYTPKALRNYVENSLTNLAVERIDLIQLHCPPTEVYYRPEIFEEFDKLLSEGKIGALGVSVEKIEEALKAIEYDNVSTVQIIFNIFRQRPNELFFEQVKKKNIGVIARVPLASGLLSGKYDSKTTFSKDDHRSFNRNGEVFDKGETFSGVDYQLGLKVVALLKQQFPDISLPILALKWILNHPQISCVIPGASNKEQLKSNISASEISNLSDKDMKIIQNIYETYIKKYAHHYW
ncbi:aldo/keto reductase [Aquimarina sp. RZ0]|uniref:aldo/keto reductase n=1 Tax=Aquimarina sp. RZ0 TaxID=2607730 RepID=UPI0011F20BE5|nr:aldo/keto reductase [Aquimarina sp. RZ0]KAA1247882.1 aldo/keto reductase [Aquimarina sp. RZ0]